MNEIEKRKRACYAVAKALGCKLQRVVDEGDAVEWILTLPGQDSQYAGADCIDVIDTLKAYMSTHPDWAVVIAPYKEFFE